MTSSGLHHLRHSVAFVTRWKYMLENVYGYKSYMDYLVVPSLFGGQSLSYLPLLNYTDRSIDHIGDLEELGRDNDYQIRVLAPGDKFQQDDMVSMRLLIEGSDAETIFSGPVTSKCRNQIRKSQKSVLEIKNGNEEMLELFYTLFLTTMHRYGTPPFAKNLFLEMLKLFDAEIFLAEHEGIPVAGIVVLYDEKIAWVGWGASLREYAIHCPNHAVYWAAIQSALRRNKQIFDFGRSGFGGATYRFKKQWGAEPCRIVHVTNKPADNLYAKYGLASRVWKNLPESVCNFMGPKLCKYLPDL